MNSEEHPVIPGSEATPASETASVPAPVGVLGDIDVSAATSTAEAEPGISGHKLDGQWTRVSTSYAWADLVINLLLVIAVAIVFVVIYVNNTNDLPLPIMIALPVIIVALIVNALLAFRRVRAIGYILREDDLLFRRGIMFERIVAVPYGRLQLVDVTRGPLLRALGLATLKFVTASAATGVHLPGLKLADAEALRDRLVELAEIRRSGL